MIKQNTVNIETSDGATVALTQVADESIDVKAHIVMTPGMFSNRRFWCSAKNVGLAAYLAQYGYRCWLYERRGTGLSSKQNQKAHTLYNAYRHDLPLVQGYLKQKGINNAFFMGHSFGGVLNTLSLAHGYLDKTGVLGIINLSSQLTVGKTLVNKPYSALVYALTALLPYFPSKMLGMGPENESNEAMRDCCRMVAWAKGKSKSTFWSGFQDIICPVLALSCEGDTVDPSPGCQAFIQPFASNDKTFIHLSKDNGNLQNYDHVGMLVSKDAQQEVWPMIMKWLDSRC